MKKQFKNLWLAGLVGSLAFVYSCGDTDTEDPAPAVPEITVAATVNGVDDTTPLSVEPGDSIGFSISITAEGGFNVYRIYSSADGGAESIILEKSRTDLTVDAGTTSVNTLANISFGSSDVGHEITLKFEAVDDANQVATTSVVINVTSPTARSYSAVLLAAPTGDFKNKNFFSVSAGTTYSGDDVTSTAEAVSPTIDFGYYYGSTDKASIASPKGFESTALSAQVGSWTTKNETVLKTTTLTTAQFTEITSYADIDAAFDAGTLDDNGVITALATDQVLAFETVGGVKGLIHIAEIKGTFNSNDYVKIDVLAQMAAE